MAKWPENKLLLVLDVKALKQNLTKRQAFHGEAHIGACRSQNSKFLVIHNKEIIQDAVHSFLETRILKLEIVRKTFSK